MMVRVAINGFGRIGQDVIRIWAARENPNFEIVLINGSDSVEIAYRAMAYDSVYGRFNGEVKIDGDKLVINGHPVIIMNERDPDKLPWEEHKIDFVIDSTGAFRTRELLQKQLDRGAKRILITAPVKGDDLTVVMGLNQAEYDPEKHYMVSNASCTTNCLAPIAGVLDEKFGIKNGIMTTIHAYTNDQKLVDAKHKDPRRARAAALNLIPTTTGAAQAVAKVLPQLEGKFTGISIRVPVPTVSIVDLVANMNQDVTVEEVNAALKEASEGKLKGILGYSDEPLVSTDYIGDKHSGTVDALSTDVIDGNVLKVIAWYDNEWGYSERVVDLAEYMIEKGL
ncbi:MAG TPA: type I glyceraldehyde-3-phosphate dehydrogenase [Tissierellia bacterium]|nr:type I glyceraldehyde-3-phosphate dehydrogenase [Tissierellia bacterium]